MLNLHVKSLLNVKIEKISNKSASSQTHKKGDEIKKTD